MPFHPRPSLRDRFGTPDEIFGPVSIFKLKDRDIYERITDRHLSSADYLVGRFYVVWRYDSRSGNVVSQRDKNTD